jgi:hypothetical protein
MMDREFEVWFFSKDALCVVSGVIIPKDFPLSLNRYVPFLYASIAASANAHIPALRAAHACYAVRPDAFELQGPI